jgi:hypothetical protein
MWSILGIITVGILISIYEVPSLLRRKLKRELWVFSILLIFGVVLSILKSLRIDILNPLDLLTNIYKPLNDFIFDSLK